MDTPGDPKGKLVRLEHSIGYALSVHPQNYADGEAAQHRSNGYGALSRVLQEVPLRLGELVEGDHNRCRM